MSHNDIITFISTQIADQFPLFYKQDGPDFVEFVRIYYEWLESTGNIVSDARLLPSSLDIDDTADEFLVYFQEQYMKDLPIEILGNQRLFQKHILELYRSKGSLTGLKLLFRLLYNEDVNVYVPSYDIFKLSDNTWKQPKYLEVTKAISLDDFYGKMIFGSTSQATALVESVEYKTINDRPVYLFYLSNISGVFAPGELVRYEGLAIPDAPKVIGSPNSLTVVTGSSGTVVGDLYVDVETNIRQKPLRAVITSTFDSSGVIDFQLLNGGTYYSMNAVISITAGANTTGSGANFLIGSIANTFLYAYSSDHLSPFGAIALNASSYGFASAPTANSANVIGPCLAISNKTVGTISSITIANPGIGYNGDVTVRIVDPYTATGMFWSGTGFGGNDAIVSSAVVVGTGLVESMTVYDSGHGYNSNNTFVQMQSETNPFKTANVTITVGGLGISEGYFDDTQSFVSSDKYLFDGHFYQDFSYAIRSSRVLANYLSILKKTVHPAGNAVYGLAEVQETIDIEISQIASTITGTAIP